ncbi:hypothetical protein F5Y18DRAFT_402529 [Xylariaceae sp. FL1019]|nr:hypothetical protein F5Y18DRAFT_402529 [Xylariaceae sp. FL1019]
MITRPHFDSCVLTGGRPSNLLFSILLSSRQGHATAHKSHRGIFDHFGVCTREKQSGGCVHPPRAEAIASSPGCARFVCRCRDLFQTSLTGLTNLIEPSSHSRTSTANVVQFRVRQWLCTNVLGHPRHTLSSLQEDLPYILACVASSPMHLAAPHIPECVKTPRRRVIAPSCNISKINDRTARTQNRAISNPSRYRLYVYTEHSTNHYNVSMVPGSIRIDHEIIGSEAFHFVPS